MMRVIWQDGTSTTVNQEQQATSEKSPERRRKRRSLDEPIVSREVSTGDAPDDTPAEANGEAAGEPAAITEVADGPVALDDHAAESAPPTDDADASETEAALDLGVLEALLFSTHHPLTTDRIKELMELGTAKHVRKAIHALNAAYEQTGRTFRIEQVAGGYQLLTLPEYGDYLKKLHQKEVDSKLTKAALETLAIIAYKQPILRAEVEAIRGVACGETIRNLMEKHLVRIAGRAEEPGRPILYGTTKRFLELFGLNNLKDLPESENFVSPLVVGPQK